MIDGLVESEVPTKPPEKRGHKHVSSVIRGSLAGAAILAGSHLVAQPSYAEGPTGITNTVEGPKATPTPTKAEKDAAIDAAFQKEKAEIKAKSEAISRERERQEQEKAVPTPVAAAIIEQPILPQSAQPTQSVGSTSLEDENAILKENNDALRTISMGSLLAAIGVFLGLWTQRLRGRRTHQLNTSTPDMNLIPQRQRQQASPHEEPEIDLFS